MIGFLAKLLAGRFPDLAIDTSRLVVTIVLVVLAVIALGIGGCVAKQAYDRSIVDGARVEGNNEALEDSAEVDTDAAAVRVSDAVRAADEVKEMQEAIQDAPDPVAARRAFYRCVRLQQQARAAGQPAPACS